MSAPAHNMNNIYGLPRCRDLLSKYVVILEGEAFYYTANNLGLCLRHRLPAVGTYLLNTGWHIAGGEENRVVGVDKAAEWFC